MYLKEIGHNKKKKNEKAMTELSWFLYFKRFSLEKYLNKRDIFPGI